jgi:hypothetical protein
LRDAARGARVKRSKVSHAATASAFFGLV